NNYMRNPPAAEIFNEEICNLLKRKIKETVSRLDDLTVRFDYEGEVTADDADAILTKVSKVHARSVAAGERGRKAGADERAGALRLVGAHLERAFYGFEPDFFQQNVARLVDDVVSLIKASVELWPTLVEICYFQKARRELPRVRVRNKRKGA